MTNTRKQYGWEWTRGVCTDMESGHPIGKLHIFTLWSERDQWVKDGAHIARTQPGYREALSGVQGDKWRKYDAEPTVHP